MDDLDWELLDRYLAGECTRAEREQLEAKMAMRREYAAAVAACRRAVDGADEELSSGEQRAMWAAIVGQIHAQTPNSAPSPAAGPPATAHRSRWRLAPRFAAAAILSVVVLEAYLLLTSPRRPSTPSAPERVATAARGQRVRLRLSDGTEVILGAGSSLRQTGTLGAGAREVVLEGQAYFAVAHDAHRPFVVRAGGLVATDRGTEFSVRAYPEDGRARVSVRSGMVAVRAAPAADGSTYDNVESVVLPGQAGWLGADGMLLIQPIDTAAAFAWTRGTLVFDGTPLHEALPELSRWYDLDFRLADPALGAIPLSGSLDQTLTPDRLNLLAASLGLEEVRSGNTVTFHRGGGTAH